MDFCRFKCLFFSQFHSCHTSLEHTFHCQLALKLNCSRQTWRLKLSIDKDLVDNREELCKWPHVAAVNSTPVSYTRHSNRRRSLRIQETFVIVAAKKKLSTVTRPTLFTANSKLNGSIDWNMVCRECWLYLDCCIQDWERKYILRLFGLDSAQNHLKDFNSSKFSKLT